MSCGRKEEACLYLVTVALLVLSLPRSGPEMLLAMSPVCLSVAALTFYGQDRTLDSLWLIRIFKSLAVFLVRRSSRFFMAKLEIHRGEPSWGHPAPRSSREPNRRRRRDEAGKLPISTMSLKWLNLSFWLWQRPRRKAMEKCLKKMKKKGGKKPAVDAWIMMW